MSDIKVDIAKRYSREIQDISNKLNYLEQGRIYEFTKAQMDGYLATNIGHLKKMFDELISKIEYGEDSTMEELSKAMSKAKLKLES